MHCSAHKAGTFPLRSSARHHPNIIKMDQEMRPSQEIVLAQRKKQLKAMTSTRGPELQRRESRSRIEEWRRSKQSRQPAQNGESMTKKQIRGGGGLNIQPAFKPL